MWKKQLVGLHEAFPTAIRLFKPATIDEIEQTEEWLGIKLGELDVDWLEFYRLTNGAGILSYTFERLEHSQRPPAGLAHYHRSILWRHNLWAEKHFVSFLGTQDPMQIGFVHKNSERRCIAMLFESYEETVLPIASSFAVFMKSFLEDVGAILRSQECHLSEDLFLLTIPDWPFDLQHLIDRDLMLRAMLKDGLLDDLFEGNNEYATIIDKALRGIPQDFKPPPFCSEQG